MRLLTGALPPSVRRFIGGAGPVEAASVAASERGIQDARLTRDAILATGAKGLEAIAMVVEIHGDAAALPLLADLSPEWVEAIRPNPHTERVVDLLERLAERNPDLARVAFSSWGRGRRVQGDLDLRHAGWLTHLPDGLRVEGDLTLAFCERLVALGAGTQVGKDLDLGFCGELAALPAELRVGGHLWLRGCQSLKALPADLKVGKVLFLDGDCPLAHCPDAELVAMAPGLGMNWTDFWRRRGIFRTGRD
jgi:hypothetical protein